MIESERAKRILELRKYAKENFTSILRDAETEIKQLGWVPADDPSVPSYEHPLLSRRRMRYRRPWADFFLTLMDIAQKRYYVTETTAKSYAEAALQPLEQELLARKWKWKRTDGTPYYKQTPSL